METPDVKYIDKDFDFDEYDGPFVIIPGTDFRYYPFGDIYQDLTEVKEFNRLHSIKQLGTVGSSLIHACQDQDRSYHSYVAAIMIDIILTRNNFSKKERQLGIASALYHDISILPYSDQGKLLKPGKYEEESLLEYFINNSPEIQERLKKYNIKVKSLVETIQGKGIIGKLLNSKEGIDADNLSYLAIDQFCTCTAPPFEDMDYLKQKKIFEQYKNIRFSDGEWVFEDLNGLLDLLKFRALMYSRIYMNPFNRAKEAFLIRRLKGENIPLDEVIRWGDYQFDNWFRNKFGEHEFGLFFYISKTPFREIAREYDLKKLEQLRKEKEKDNVIVEYLKAPRNALKNLVVYKNEVRLLNEIPEYAERVKKIEDIIKKLNYIGVFEKATAEQNFDFRCSDTDLLDIAEGNIPQISR